MSRKARVVTIIFGVITLLTLILSTLLILLVRDTRVINESNTSEDAVVVDLVAYKDAVDLLDKTPEFFKDFIQSTDVANNISPLASVFVTPSVSTNTAPPNMIDPDATLNYPLQTHPSTFGSAVLTIDGSMFMTGMENGEIGVGQFQHNEKVGIDENYDFYKIAYEKPRVFQNRILTLVKNDGNGNQILNTNASNVGNVGPWSIALSDDNLRLYAAYVDPSTSDGSLFPFEQYGGKVAIWGRLANSSTGSAVEASSNWSHLTNNSDQSGDVIPDLTNPFGSQVSGFSIQNFGNNEIPTLGYNNFTNVIEQGDGFGKNIQTSTNLTNSARMVAISSNFGFDKNDGRCINIFEEQTDLSHTIVGILCLPSNLTRFSNLDKNSFAESFTIVNDTCIASYGSHNEQPTSRKLAIFKRNESTQQWNFVNTIGSPTTTEYFGTSLHLNALANLLVVGSPVSSTLQNGNGNGGHVYMYSKDITSGVWSLQDTLEDPYPNSKALSYGGAFGWFINVNNDFTLMSVTQNQYNAYTDMAAIISCPLPTDLCCGNGGQGSFDPTTCKQTAIVLVGIDQITQTFKSETTPRFYQNGSQILNEHTILPDPLFGATVQFSTDTNVNSVLEKSIILSSPRNSQILWYKYFTV
jgi:hypothetical protein